MRTAATVIYGIRWDAVKKPESLHSFAVAGRGRPFLGSEGSIGEGSAHRAAGADGLLIEAYKHPVCARSDAHQTLDFGRFAGLMDWLRAVAQAIGRSI